MFGLYILEELTKDSDDENLDGYQMDQSEHRVCKKFQYQTEHLQSCVSLNPLMVWKRDKEHWSIPMNAMSYFTSSDARQGKYGRRPKVEIPENTESACAASTFLRMFTRNALAYLGTSITW